MASGGAVRLSAASLSAIGMRASNQDAIGAVRQDEMSCFVIADGAGGHEGGEIASKLVVDAVLEKFNGESSFGARALRSYIEHAIAQVAQAKRSSARLQDMSATVAALLVDQTNGRAVWAHLGDTRLYLFRGKRLHAVTKDHSLTQQLIDAGYARADQLRLHPQRNILFAAVGAEGETAVAVSEAIVELEDGDAFLACTDGLWEWVQEADMERTLAEATDSEQWLAAMCRLADAAVDAAGKSRDNYSVYAIQVHRQDSPT
jgi:serine/threonine protein phosphatase PrpC